MAQNNSHRQGSNASSTTSSTPSPTLEKVLQLSPTPSPASMSAEVRIVPLSEFEQAATCLCEAFAVDEVARYFLDTDDMARYSEKVKYKLHCDIIRYLTAAHCMKGLVTTVGDFEAVALWMPPHTTIDDIWTLFRSGMWRLYYKLSREGRKRFYSEFMPLLHDTKQEILGKERDDDSYYLVYLGSKPSARGKGYARLLIEDMTKKADAESRATYLESSSAANLPYYKRFGFEEKRDIQLMRGPKPIVLHIMVREPKKMEEGKDGEGKK